MFGTEAVELFSDVRRMEREERLSMTRNEIEDGMGFSGFLPSKEERQKIIPQTPIVKKIRVKCPKCNLLTFHKLLEEKGVGMVRCQSCKGYWRYVKIATTPSG